MLFAESTGAAGIKLPVVVGIVIIPFWVVDAGGKAVSGLGFCSVTTNFGMFAFVVRTMGFALVGEGSLFASESKSEPNKADTGGAVVSAEDELLDAVVKQVKDEERLFFFLPRALGGRTE